MAEELCKVGWTYFIGTDLGQPFKVGKTNRPDHRLCNLQVGNPNRLIFLVAFETTTPGHAEERFHARFAEHRMVGEWFSWSDDAAEVIAELRLGRTYELCPEGATGRVRIGERYHRFTRGKR